jgi:hypothetical protein
VIRLLIAKSGRPVCVFLDNVTKDDMSALFDQIRLERVVLFWLRRSPQPVAGAELHITVQLTKKQRATVQYVFDRFAASTNRPRLFEGLTIPIAIFLLFGDDKEDLWARDLITDWISEAGAARPVLEFLAASTITLKPCYLPVTLAGILLEPGQQLENGTAKHLVKVDSGSLRLGLEQLARMISWDPAALLSCLSRLIAEGSLLDPVSALAVARSFFVNRDKDSYYSPFLMRLLNGDRPKRKPKGVLSASAQDELRQICEHVQNAAVRSTYARLLFHQVRNWKAALVQLGLAFEEAQSSDVQEGPPYLHTLKGDFLRQMFKAGLPHNGKRLDVHADAEYATVCQSIETLWSALEADFNEAVRQYDFGATSANPLAFLGLVKLRLLLPTLLTAQIRRFPELLGQKLFTGQSVRQRFLDPALIELDILDEFESNRSLLANQTDIPKIRRKILTLMDAVPSVLDLDGLRDMDAEELRRAIVSLSETHAFSLRLKLFCMAELVQRQDHGTDFSIDEALRVAKAWVDVAPQDQRAKHWYAALSLVSYLEDGELPPTTLGDLPRLNREQGLFFRASRYPLGRVAPLQQNTNLVKEGLPFTARLSRTRCAYIAINELPGIRVDYPPGPENIHEREPPVQAYLVLRRNGLACLATYREPD